ncbi:MAG: rod shape-determining protein MreD [Acidobacteria bacterium]|nr:rod shape-determining protein MreD [Acidobacteriota bacterium]
MKAARVMLAIAVALAMQTTLAGLTFGSRTALDLVLVVVVFTGLAYGPGAALFAGTVGGLAQDALAGRIIGVTGLAKSLVGFFSGVIGSQFIVTQPLPRFTVFMLATMAHEFCTRGLYALLAPGGFIFQWAPVLGQGIANGLVGIVAFQVVELLPGAVQRRRLGRGGIRPRVHE